MSTAPSAPTTTICAVGQAKMKSGRSSQEHIAGRAPPTTFPTAITIFGTVASAQA